MKTERLYAITVYLLNHGRVSARELAQHFEVSVRTIQRDMDSLCLAGIPIVSTTGVSGGYEISERFQLDRHAATADDYSHILTALKGFVSATENPGAKRTLEKFTQLASRHDSSIILDFSVLREGEPDTLQALQTAVTQKRVVTFLYTNNDDETHTHSAEPIAVLYRWYAWYLLAYSQVKKDYRIYKLIRMSNLTITDRPFSREHESADAILKKKDQTDSFPCTELLVKCKAKARSRAREYLNGTVLEEFPDGGALMTLSVIENEQLWIGTLLSLGDGLEVLAPEHIRKRISEAAAGVLALYQ